MNDTLLKLKNSATVALSDKIRKYKTEGRTIIALQTGDPDFNTPKIIIETCTDALAGGLTHYSFSQGLPELRSAVASYNDKKFGTKISSEENILITSGGVHALYIIANVLFAPGDEVIVIDPSWMPYKSVITIAGAVPVVIDTKAENNFIAEINEIRKYISKKTKAIIINSPNNPTGSVVNEKYYIELLELAREYDLYIISDEVYNEIIFDGRKPLSLAAFEDKPSRVIVINSFSKTFAMTGWRIGYIIAGSKIIEQCLKLVQYTITNVPPFIQKAATIALQNNEVDKEVINMVKIYEKRKNIVRQLCMEHLGARIRMVDPGGAFYIFWDIRKMNITSEQFCDELLDKYQVAVVPGNVYGNCGEGFVRMTIAASEIDIVEGTKRMLEFSK